MKVQVLAIGIVKSGKGATGREWHRRTFQVFVIDSQVSGNIPVYGELDDLKEYKTGGLYDAATEARAGQNGRIELVITKLTPQKP